MVTIEPGGVFGPLHDHKDRPGIVYVLQGTITDHRNGAAKDYGPGVGWPEDRNTTHWLENRGRIPAIEISVDIVRQEQAQAGHPNTTGRKTRGSARSVPIRFAGT
jgi:quercetin dioxygenase-like cupin family protein